MPIVKAMLSKARMTHQEEGEQERDGIDNEFEKNSKDGEE